MLSYIHRSIEPVLKGMAGHFPAVAVTGPRQSGKSTLLQQVFPDYAYLTLDDPLVLQQALHDPELLLESAGPRVVIEEIQYAPSLLPRLKLRVNRHRSQPGQFILTGSQQFVLMKGLGETLAGRIGLLELLPFGLEEKTRCPGKEHLAEEPRAAFMEACLRGSYPEPVLQPKFDATRWYGAYVWTYLERDIRFRVQTLGDAARGDGRADPTVPAAVRRVETGTGRDCVAGYHEPSTQCRRTAVVFFEFSYRGCQQRRVFMK